jgi:hypothetical protein
MPTVKIHINGVLVELEANEVSAADLCERALDTLAKAHEIERQSTDARIAGASKGRGYL